MAITIVQQPKSLVPAYNPIYTVVDSTNKSQLGFRYVYSVYDDETNTLIGSTLPVAPEPVNGYGAVDISKLIQSQVSYTLDLNSTVYEAPNNYVKYRIEVYESYLYSWDFTGITGTIGQTNFTLQGTTPSVWEPNDEITIVTSTGGTPYDGSFTVLTTPGNLTVALANYQSGYTATTGTVYWANNRKTTSTATTISDLYAFNGVRSFKDFFNYSEVTYLIDQAVSSTTKNLLTDLPVSGFTVTPEQDLWLSLFRDPTTTGQTIQYRIENSNGDVFYNAANLSSYSSFESTVAAGPGNINPLLLSGSLPVIKSDTTYYDFWLAETQANGGSQLSQKYRINVDQRCKISDKEILFKDRMGSWLSFAFQLKDKETGTIERQNYNKYLGAVDSVNGWEYNLSDAGQTNYSVNVIKEFELNTNWMNDEMSVMFEQLLSSPTTFIKMDDGIYYSCIVQDNGFETARQRNKILIKKSVRVRMSNLDAINV